MTLAVAVAAALHCKSLVCVPGLGSCVLGFSPPRGCSFQMKSISNTRGPTGAGPAPLGDTEPAQTATQPGRQGRGREPPADTGAHEGGGALLNATVRPSGSFHHSRWQDFPRGKPARRSACSSCAGTYGAPRSPRATACSGPRCTTQWAGQARWLCALPGATGGTSTRLRACRSKNKINYIR